MNMREAIAQANNVRPKTVHETIKVNGVEIPATFRVLPHIELEKLRIGNLGDDGVLDRDLYASSAARYISAMVIDPSTSEPAYALDEVKLWDDLVVKAFAKVCKKINADEPGAVDAAVKNSDPTQSDELS